MTSIREIGVLIASELGAFIGDPEVKIDFSYGTFKGKLLVTEAEGEEGIQIC